MIQASEQLNPANEAETDNPACSPKRELVEGETFTSSNTGGVNHAIAYYIEVMKRPANHGFGDRSSAFLGNKIWSWFFSAS